LSKFATVQPSLNRSLLKSTFWGELAISDQLIFTMSPGFQDLSIAASVGP
jgi:hypothetical protein